MELTDYSKQPFSSIEREEMVRQAIYELYELKGTNPNFVEKVKEFYHISDVIKLGDAIYVAINIRLTAIYARTVWVRATAHNQAGALLYHYFNVNEQVKSKLFRSYLIEGQDFPILCPAVRLDDCFYFVKNRFLMGTDMMAKLNELKSSGYSFRGMYVREIEMLEYDTTIKNCQKHFFYRINYFSDNSNAILNVTI